MKAFGQTISYHPRHRRRRTRLRVVGATTTALVFVGAGVAYAAWTSSANGDAAAKSGSITFTLQATSTTTGSAIVNTLRPGSAAGTTSGDATGGDLKVTLNNTSGFTVHVVSVTLNGLVTNDKSPSCSNDTGTFPGSVVAGNHGVSVGTAGTYTLPVSTFTVAGDSANHDIVIPNALNMATTSNTACQVCPPSVETSMSPYSTWQ